MPTATASAGHPEGFGFWVAVCCTLNAIMGTGFLTLPWAFAKAGVVLTTVMLVAATLLGNVAKDLVLEVMARADYLYHRKDSVSENEGAEELAARVAGCADDDCEVDDDDEDGHKRGDDDPFLLSIKPQEDVAVVGRQHIEIAQLCDYFLGPSGPASRSCCCAGRRAYAAVLSVFCYGTLWAYAAVFASALAQDLPISHDLAQLWWWPLPASFSSSYHCYLALFAVICVPLTCTELKDQAWLQVVLSACRLVMVVVMVGTTTAAIYSAEPVFGSRASGVGGDVPLAEVSGLRLALPIVIYANVFHHAIPSLSQPVEDKRSLHKVFGVAFLLCACFYTAIGVSASYCFGQGTLPSSNLNWTSYRGHASMPAWLVSAVRHYVILFPALDVCSAFPLNGITLGNNLLSTYSGSSQAGHGNAARIRFRLLAAVPPVLGAACLRDLGAITGFTGSIALLITFVLPVLLHQRSRAAATRLRGREVPTVYSNMMTRKPAVPLLLLVFGVVGAGYTLAWTAMEAVRGHGGVRPA